MIFHNNSMIKMLTMLVSLMAGVLFSVAASASVLEDGILDRIKPAGEVCVAGDDCAGAAAPVAVSSAGPRSGEDIYQSACFGCHGTGAAGAPKMGDVADWSARTAKGLDAVIANAINGFSMMPARGTCMSCSDDEIASTVQYMVDNSQ